MGRVLTETDALGNETSFEWDNLGRLIERTEAGVDRAAAVSNPKAIGFSAKKHKSRKGCSVPAGSSPGVCGFCDSLRQNRVVAVEQRNSSDALQWRVEYTYDVFDRLIERSVDEDGDSTVDEVQRFVYDQFVKGGLDDVVLVSDGSDNLTERLLHGPAVDQVFASEDALGDILWHLGDNQNTIRDVADYDATLDETTVVNHRTFDSFGELLTESGTSAALPLAFQGRYRDPLTGLQNHRGRWYDSVARRWIANDPIGFGGGDGNLARFVANGPVNFLDPSGFDLLINDEHQTVIEGYFGEGNVTFEPVREGFVVRPTPDGIEHLRNYDGDPAYIDYLLGVVQDPDSRVHLTLANQRFTDQHHTLRPSGMVVPLDDGGSRRWIPNRGWTEVTADNQLAPLPSPQLDVLIETTAVSYVGAVAVVGTGAAATEIGTVRVSTHIAQEVLQEIVQERVRTRPINLKEQLTMEEAKAGAGTSIMEGKINDPKYRGGDWLKMEHVHSAPDGTNYTIHYWFNIVTGETQGFKFKVPLIPVNPSPPLPRLPRP